MLSLTPSVAQVLRDAGADVASDTGLLVLETYTGGPADRAGVRGGNQKLRFGRLQLVLGGDIITAIDEQPTNDGRALTVHMEMETAKGDRVELTIIRDGKELQVPLVLDEQPQS